MYVGQQSVVLPYGEPAPTGWCDPSVVGVNAIFWPLVPYAIVAALHDDDLRLALIIGTAIAGGLILIGLLLRWAGGYRAWPYAFELALVTILAVQLGVSYEQPVEIWKYYTFITNGSLAVFALLSMVFATPFTLQYVREFVPVSAENHAQTRSAAYQTTAGFAAVSVISTLLYLIPIAEGVEDEHTNALNLVFRIILPIFLFLFAAIYTRMWPQRVLAHLRRSQGFDATPRRGLYMTANPAYLGGTPVKAYGTGV